MKRSTLVFVVCSLFLMIVACGITTSQAIKEILDPNARDDYDYEAFLQQDNRPVMTERSSSVKEVSSSIEEESTLPPPLIGKLIYGAVGGGKENFLADPVFNQILSDKYDLRVQNDPWSNGKLVASSLYINVEGVQRPYDFAFFSDARFYDYYQLSASGDEAPRLPRVKNAIALNTPIVIYSWDKVADALMRENIVTQRDGVYYITDMGKLLDYITEGKDWSEIGLPEIYGKISITSTDPITSSPGATYYGLLAAIMAHGNVNANNLEEVLPELKQYYKLSGFMLNAPADLFELYLRTGMGGQPMIVDYEKSIIDFANNNPEGYASLRSRIRILYPVPTVWNSHCVTAFTQDGSQYIDALNEKEVQQLAFEKYGFRTGLYGGQYDVGGIAVSGIPQSIDTVVPGLKMEMYTQIINTLKAN